MMQFSLRTATVIVVAVSSLFGSPYRAAAADAPPAAALPSPPPAILYSDVPVFYIVATGSDPNIPRMVGAMTFRLNRDVFDTSKLYVVPRLAWSAGSDNIVTQCQNDASGKTAGGLVMEAPMTASGSEFLVFWARNWAIAQFHAELLDCVSANIALHSENAVTPGAAGDARTTTTETMTNASVTSGGTTLVSVVQKGTERLTTTTASKNSETDKRTQSTDTNDVVSTPSHITKLVWVENVLGKHAHAGTAVLPIAGAISYFGSPSNGNVSVGIGVAASAIGQTAGGTGVTIPPLNVADQIGGAADDVAGIVTEHLKAFLRANCPGPNAPPYALSVLCNARLPSAY